MVLQTSFRLTSEDAAPDAPNRATLAPDLRTTAAVWQDTNTVDLYLTDLPRAALDPTAPLDGITGNIVHIHMFLAPRAGRTPIEDTAQTATVRHLVLSRGLAGVYAGGGFLQPRTSFARDRFAGTMNAGTARLIAADPGFVDALGPARIDTEVLARRDPRTARLIAARLETILARTPRIERDDPEQEPPAADASPASP
jgi:hypothetical protein